MTDERPEAETREEIERQAADWIVLLSDPSLDAGRRAALREARDRWLAAAPARRSAYAEIERTWRLLREAAIAAGSLRPESEVPAPAPAPTPTPPPAQPRRRDARRPAAPPRPAGTAAGRLGRGLAAALALVLLLGLARLYLGDPLLAVSADYRTAPGELRSLALADGSRVTLGSNSALAVEDEAGERRVRLLAGEAAFEVVPDPAGDRPFVAAADGLSARALGTRFQLERGEEGVRVTVIEHLVRVTPKDRPPEAAVVLGPGERLTVPADGATEVLEPVDLERATAWQRGRLVFDRQPLSAVVAVLNRHRRGEIVVADAALARREVSGVFRLDELDGAVARIARELGASRLELPFVSLLY